MISGFREKLGFWSENLKNTWKSKKDWIWFHAVSVGELNAVWPLILTLKKEKSVYPIMISTTTKAGYNLAKKLTSKTDFVVFYFPFDFFWIIKSLLKYAKIKLFVIIETEIWPFTLMECNKQNIPIILVNARLSDRSFKNYYVFKFFFRKIINLFNEVYAQTESDKNKFIKIGAEKDKVKVLGNIKFFTEDLEDSLSSCKQPNIVCNGTTNIIFASTHNGEEKIALETYQELSLELPEIRLIIAPRHIERVKEISKLITDFGFNTVLKSSGKKTSSPKDIFVLDTIGELRNFYKISKISVVGGTFTEIGGHNILEPIYANSYTIIGPFDFKIKDISNLFQNNKALTKVANKTELKGRIKEALENNLLFNTKIKNGKDLIKQNEHIFKLTSEQVLKYL